jgi:hypothetical protein
LAGSFSFGGHRKSIRNRRERLGLCLPVLVIAQEVVFVPVVHCGFQEQPAHAQMAHLLEAAIRGVNAAANDSETAARHLLAEQVILGERDLLVKAAELAKLAGVEQHEHSGGKRMVQARQILEEVVARVKEFVDPVAALAENVGGHTMKLLALSQFNRTAYDGGMRQLDIGVEEEYVVTLSLRRAQVAANRRHAAADYLDVQAIAKTHHDFRGAIG